MGMQLTDLSTILSDTHTDSTLVVILGLEAVDFQRKSFRFLTRGSIVLLSYSGSPGQEKPLFFFEKQVFSSPRMTTGGSRGANTALNLIQECHPFHIDK